MQRALQLLMHLVLNQRLELNQEPKVQTLLKLKPHVPPVRKVQMATQRPRPRKNQLTLVLRLNQQKKSRNESQSPKRAEIVDPCGSQFDFSIRL